nr:two-component response regulator ARR3 [Tanacetum cinerariifolium]
NQLVEIIDVEKILAEVAPVSENISVGVVTAEVQHKALSLRVLTVDDSSVARKQVTRCLQTVGVEVTALNDGRQALEFLRKLVDEGKKPEEEFLMMISDIEMPEMDGYTLTAEIRSDPRMQKLHIVLHTSLSGVFNQAMVKKVGADDFLAKFRPDDLAARVFRVFLEKACGILLGENKQYLVSSRLNKLMEQQSIKSLGELIQRIQTQPRSGLREQVVDAMTTNETLWFRDTYPFEVLKNKVLPEAIKASPNQRLRIWSAACSSGQEPYSLSMSIDEFERSNPGQLKSGVQIVATDLSGTMLNNCKTGEYDSLAIGRGLSPDRLQRFFDQKTPGRWTVKAPIKSRVEFRSFNLLDSYAALGKFDMVFCRNVLIYFSADVKKDILLRIHSTLKPGGYLFLGQMIGCGFDLLRTPLRRGFVDCWLALDRSGALRGLPNGRTVSPSASYLIEPRLQSQRAAKGLCSWFGPPSSGSFTPVLLRGPAPNGHPCPDGALAAFMPLGPLRKTWVQPAPKSRFAVTELFAQERAKATATARAKASRLKPVLRDARTSL